MRKLSAKNMEHSLFSVGESSYSNILKKSMFWVILGRREYGRRRSVMIAGRKWQMEGLESKESL